MHKIAEGLGIYGLLRGICICIYVDTEVQGEKGGSGGYFMQVHRPAKFTVQLQKVLYITLW